MRTIDDMIRQEVHYRVSGLVSTLAQGAHAPGLGVMKLRELSDLLEQAANLAAPVDDYEEAAVQAGWKPVFGEEMNTEMARVFCESAVVQIDPYQREVFEHWIVSDWFAEKLAAHGEKVDTDFAGMTVWARCTTGQAISMDGVVQQIYREMMK